ncbi:MAG: glycosyltransferase family 4 protein [Acidimicrobiales bacterium]
MNRTATAARPTLAIIDYETVPTNPVGSVHRRVIAALADRYDITVFSVRFDNPRPDRVRWVRVPAVRRPLLALFCSFHLMVLLRYGWERLRRHRFDVVQSIESFSLLGAVVHAQFCHRFFVDHAELGSWAPGYRGWVRQVFERAAGLLEPLAFRRAALIVVPSLGAGRSITEYHPSAAAKLRLAYNGVDLNRFVAPPRFDAVACRRELGVPGSACVLVFVALGHFERKGLPVVLDAMQQLGDPVVHLLVVGGTAQATAPYRRRVGACGLEDRVHFCGAVDDVRPFLWCADAFVLPSSYEGFPLVALEAAAAGLPLLATPVNGVEEILVDGDTGLVLDRDATGVADVLRRFLALEPAARRSMGRAARRAVERYSDEAMVAAWSRAYDEVRGRTAARVPSRSTDGRNTVRR